MTKSRRDHAAAAFARFQPSLDIRAALASTGTTRRSGGLRTFSEGAKSPRRSGGSRLSDQASKPNLNPQFAAPVPKWEDADDADFREETAHSRQFYDFHETDTAMCCCASTISPKANAI